jgi:hypothetical protein
MPPKVQFINIGRVLPPGAEMTKAIETLGKLLVGWDTDVVKSIAAPSSDVERMRRQFAAVAAWGTCRVGETLGGNGTSSSTVRLVCDKGPMAARVMLDPNTRKLTGVELFPLREQKCVP